MMMDMGKIALAGALEAIEEREMIPTEEAKGADFFPENPANLSSVSLSLGDLVATLHHSLQTAPPIESLYKFHELHSVFFSRPWKHP